MDREKLIALAERCEAASGPDREIDLEIARLRGVTVWLRNDDDTGNYETTHWHYTGSLDGAMALVPKGAFWRIEDHPSYGLSAIVDGQQTFAATPSLALCAASLRALAAGEGE